MIFASYLVGWLPSRKAGVGRGSRLFVNKVAFCDQTTFCTKTQYSDVG